MSTGTLDRHPAWDERFLDDLKTKVEVPRYKGARKGGKRNN
jgi:hypothetical protein